MMSPKKEAELYHKIAALSYLISEALDELNHTVKDSDPFKEVCDNMSEKCLDILEATFGIEEVRSGVYLQNMANKIDTVVRKNFERIPETK